MGLLVIDDNCLISDGGWLDVECMYRVVLFDFLKGKYDRGWNKQGVGMRILISWGGRWGREGASIRHSRVKNLR